MSRLGLDLTWLGHSAFHIRPTDGGPDILIDPWITNPKAPPNARQLAAAARLILVTHGHSDHIGEAVAIARDSGARLLTSVEVASELVADGLPAEQVQGYNKGGTVIHAGVAVTLTQAFHSSSLEQPDGRSRSVGDPCGLIIELPNGTVIYDTGDSCVFGDMALIAEIYRPTILLLPIGDFYTMGPREAAKACQLVDAAWIVPHHYGTFPALSGTPDALRTRLPPAMRERLLVPAPGETIS